MRQIAQYGTMPPNRRLPQRLPLSGLCFSDIPVAASLIARLLASVVKLLHESRDLGESRSSIDSNSGSLVAKPIPPAPGIVSGTASGAGAAAVGAGAAVDGPAAATLAANGSSGYLV